MSTVGLRNQNYKEGTFAFVWYLFRTKRADVLKTAKGNFIYQGKMYFKPAINKSLPYWTKIKRLKRAGFMLDKNFEL